jgi:regulator of replication initiation timing
MAIRIPGKNRLSSVSIFSSKLKCGDCGSWYGSKVWHSNDQYRKTIWQCNHKFSGESKCQTPHLTEDEIQAFFIKAASQLIANKDEIVSNFQSLKETLFSISKLEQEQDELGKEVNGTAELMQDCIKENARVPLDQAKYEKRYSELTERFDKAKARYEKVTQLIVEKEARRGLVEAFLEELQKLGPITAFDEDVWMSMVDTVTVRSKDDITFTFKDGTEIKVP